MSMILSSDINADGTGTHVPYKYLFRSLTIYSLGEEFLLHFKMHTISDLHDP